MMDAKKFAKVIGAPRTKKVVGKDPLKESGFSKLTKNKNLDVIYNPANSTMSVERVVPGKVGSGRAAMKMKTRR